MIEPFTFTDEQRDSIMTVLRHGLGLDTDQIECQYEYQEAVPQFFYTSGMGSLRDCIETAARSHILHSLRESQRPGYKARIKPLIALRNRVKALPVNFKNALAPIVTAEGARHHSMMPLVVHRATVTLVSVLDASIAAQRPQPTANSSKSGRDRFWNEVLAIWTSIGGEETGGDAADFLIAVSTPVFCRMRDDGHKKTASMPQYRDSVIEWLRLRAKARKATTS
jgi:hypothetical protein